MMSTFPDPRYALSVAAMGEDLRVDTLREAHARNLPVAARRLPLPWFSPRRCTVIFFRRAARRLLAAQGGSARRSRSRSS
jgi:hypothetical protein